METTDRTRGSLRLEAPAEPLEVRRRVDTDALARDLARAMRGEVRFDAQAKGLYALDASNFRQVPLGVVFPRDADDVVAAMRVCHRHGAPVHGRGGGTSLAGQCVNVGVVFDYSKHMNRILEIDPERRLARVQPGVILDHLRDAAEEHGLTFGPDPATHDRCTLGGMVGNNSCGVHSVMAGRTADNVHELEVVTVEGDRFRVGSYDDAAFDRIAALDGPLPSRLRKLKVLRDRYAARIRERYPDIPRRVSGYNLDELLSEKGFHVARALVGTESTCVAVTEAVVRLVRSPPCRTLVVLGYPDVFRAGDHVPEILEHAPVGLEGIDEMLVEDMEEKDLHARNLGLLPEGRGWLLVEVGGETRQEADAKARALVRALERDRTPPSCLVLSKEEQQERIWEIRESGLAATARHVDRPDAWPGWEDSAVPPDHVGDYLRDLKALFHRHGYDASVYGHFGDGCIHCRIPFDLTSEEGIRTYRSFLDQAADLVISYGGSLSGEHGDGQQRAWLLSKMYGADLVRAMEEFKAIWDPVGLMNPGKVVHARAPDEDLRLGADYAPWRPDTIFPWRGDDGQFERATLRCVGVGACRREEGGVMCPSYKVTREEAHSTRGRAHLLHEMLLDDTPVSGRWQSEEVEDALSLCLSCKGCRTQCPMKVDMANLKAEFMYHHYQGRLRPRAAYSMGLIYWWSKAARLAPELVNLVTQTPGLSWLAKTIAGIAPSRDLPAYAPRTFRSWFTSRGTRNVRGPRVLLWVDTWTNHFRPEVGVDAVEVLEACGFRVEITGREICCGRPLYDHGMLKPARALLRQVLRETRPWVDDGVPVVVLEPSCFSVFRDELLDFWPEDEDAKALHRRIRTLAQLVEERAPHFQPRLARAVKVHGHCHQKAGTGLQHEQKVLERIGARPEQIDSGCCGMAGTFGYEPEKVEVSVQVAENGFLPPLRQADDDTILMIDGFSCSTQLGDLDGGRRPLHLAQILRMALDEGPHGPSVRPIERARRGPPGPSPWRLAATAAVAAGTAAGMAWWWSRRR